MNCQQFEGDDPSSPLGTSWATPVQFWAPQYKKDKGNKED